MNSSSQRQFTIIGAIISSSAVISQYFLLIENTVETFSEATIRFFSYFTILTNVLAQLMSVIISALLIGIKKLHKENNPMKNNL